MKKPQIFGNKIITRYTDANSLVLKSYIDISSQRLSKVRAGSHLAAVLKSSAQLENPDTKRGDQLSNFDTERDLPPVDPNFLANRTQDDAASKNLPLSKFMEQYQNQKGVDANILSTKENNIYHFFKEKFDLMGKYLGEDVLKEGLLSSGSIDKVQVIQEKNKGKKMDMEGREHYLLGLMNKDVANDPREGQNAKVVRINREIMSQILREEHKKEMDELLKLQTEQNMQVFNDLQDIDVKDNNQKVLLTSRNKTPPSKMILKNNFLRTFVNIEAGDRPFTSNTQAEYNSDPFRKTQPIRPVTEQLVFRTKQKKEQLIPNVEEISTNLNLHKFGFKPINASENSDASRNLQSRQGENPSPMLSGDKFVPNLKIKTGFSVPKLESPKIGAGGMSENSNLRPTTRSVNRNYTQSIGFRSDSVKSLIHEEIEFLRNERNTGRSNQNLDDVPAQSRQGFPQRKIQIYYDDQNEIKNTMIFPKTTANIQNSSKGFSFGAVKKGMTIGSSNHSKKSSAVSKHPAEQIILSKKPLVNIHPQVDNSTMRSMNRNSLTQKHSNKVNTPSRWSPEASEAKQKGPHKQSSYVTKLVSVKRPELVASNSRNNLLPMMVNDLEYSKQNPAGSILKNSFGNKYWRNNFN